MRLCQRFQNLFITPKPKVPVIPADVFSRIALYLEPNEILTLIFKRVFSNTTQPILRTVLAEENGYQYKTQLLVKLLRSIKENDFKIFSSKYMATLSTISRLEFPPNYNITSDEFKTLLCLCNKIVHLDLEKCTSITDKAPIMSCSNLQLLDLSGTYEFSFSSFAVLKNLQLLRLRNCKIQSITPWENCGQLIALDISQNPLKNISPLKKFKKLQSLYISSCGINDASDLKELKELEELDISWNCRLTSLPSLPNLTSLNCTACAIQDLNCLKTLKLQALHLNNCNVTDLKPLEEVPVTYLDIGSNLKLENLTPLLKKTSLKFLNIKYINLTTKSFLLLKETLKLTEIIH